MRTHFENDGVGPSRMNSWCHAGGDTNAFGGAVMVHVFPLHVNSGKMVRPPIMLPCVEDVPATSETRIVLVVPSKSSTVI